jgi:peptidyl-prolyl cis-trans isomerase SurA
MKSLLALILFLNFSTCFAENTILAIVNNEVITLNSVEQKLNIANSNEEKIAIIKGRIDTILQLTKVREFNISPTQLDINQALIQLANINEITIEQLNSYPEISLLTREVAEKLSILNLQRFITKDLILNLSSNELIDNCPAIDNDIKIKQIKVAQIIISEIDDSDTSPNDKDKAIKEFLKKLSKHISKGASFESFAKLHSQHPSYANGGISDWITVNSPTAEMLDLLRGGEVSNVYSTNMGFAIAIKVDERFISDNLEKCKEKLTYLNAEQFYLNWLKELRDNADIEIYTNNLY